MDHNQLSESSYLLPSQRALIERFRYFNEHGDYLLVLHGIDGVGKTTLVHALLDENESFNQAFVHVDEKLTAAEMREQIVRQWFPHAVFNPEDPLIDTISSVRKPSSMRFLLVLDEADYLPNDITNELLAVLMAQESLGFRANFVLVGDDSLISWLQQRLPETYHQKLTSMEVEPLSMRERFNLFTALSKRNTNMTVELPDSAVVEKQLARQSGSAREVVEYFDSLDKTSVSRIENINSLWQNRWVGGLVGLLLLAVAGKGVYSLTSSSEPDLSAQTEPDFSVDVPAPVITPSEPIPTIDPHATALDLGLAKDWDGTLADEDEDLIVLLDPELEIPDLEDEFNVDLPEVASEFDSVVLEPMGSEQEVIEPVELPASALSEDRVSTSGSAELEPELTEPDLNTTALTEERLTESGITTDTSTVDSSDSEPVMPKSVLQPLPVIVAGKNIVSGALMSRPETGYVIQLGVFSVIENALVVADELMVDSASRLYTTERDGKTLYVLVHGGYADIDTAKIGLGQAQASEVLKKYSPYIKSLVRVQNELVSEIDLAEFLGKHR